MGGALRRVLDAVYLLGGVAGAVALVTIGVVIAAQVIGRQFGTTVLGADDLTAFAVAASATLPLAYAFRHGAHIRVDLFIGRMRGRVRYAAETLALLASAGLAAFFAYSMADLAYDSFEFDDVAQGMVPWKLWIPQSLTAIGAGLFALSLLDDLVVHLAGGEPSYRRAAEAASAELKAAEEL